MSRREIIVNSLCGLLLIGALFAPLLVLYFVIVLTKPFIVHYSSLLGLPEGFWNAAITALIVIPVISQQFQKRHWQETFLSLAVMWQAALTWFAEAHHFKVLDFFPSVGVFVLLILNDRRVERREFHLGAFVIAWATAMNTGLVGTGAWTGVVTVCTMIAILRVVYVRNNSSEEPALPAPVMSV